MTVILGRWTVTGASVCRDQLGLCQLKLRFSLFCVDIPQVGLNFDGNYIQNQNKTAISYSFYV